MNEYEIEPIRGLPGQLPPGERILWQGAPAWRILARTAFHTRLVTGYFALLSGWAMASALAGQAGYLGVVMTVLVGVIGVGLLHLIAWGSARTTVYTLTNRRMVMRIGIAVPKCINLPLAMIESIDLAVRSDGTGDLPLTIKGAPKLGFLALWPHARPWKIARPQPMLRAVADGEKIAALIAQTCFAAGPDGQIAVTQAPRQPVSAFPAKAAAA